VTPIAAQTCPACGSGAEADDRFCESCGHELAYSGNAVGPAAPGNLSAPGTFSAPGKLTALPVNQAGGSPHPCAECGCSRISADGYCERCGHRQPAGRDHVELEAGSAAGVSDRGRLPRRNEDAMAVTVATAPDGTQLALAVVCDGVSTTPLAADASLAAAQDALRVLASAAGAGRDMATASTGAVASAARAVTALARKASPASPGAPSCTYVSAVVGPSSVTLAWLGDSRAYWLARSPGATASCQLTADDSWAAEQVASGALTADEAYADHRAHAITGWLGADADVAQPHVITFVPDGPGAVLLCTDGLWNYLPAADQLAAAAPDAGTMPLATARDLVRIALQAGGHDNITAVLIPAAPGESHTAESHIVESHTAGSHSGPSHSGASA
jgi:serine/threonine protein phosphatase PrpC